MRPTRSPRSAWCWARIGASRLPAGHHLLRPSGSGPTHPGALSLSTSAALAFPAADAVALIREENERLAEAVSRHPDRFAAFATLPMTDPNAAAGELDLHPAPPPAAVADAYYAGFSPQVSFVLGTTAWGWHTETGLHVLRLVLAGAFDRFPGLQVVVGHLGEALPFMLARTGSWLPPATTGLERTVPEYLRGHVHLTTSGFFSVPPFLNALLEMGADRILFSVDYPFSANQEGRAFLDSMPVSQADREKIAHGNAERLLRLR